LNNARTLDKIVIILYELEERIAEGPVVFTPDEEFERRVEERRKEKEN